MDLRKRTEEERANFQVLEEALSYERNDLQAERAAHAKTREALADAEAQITELESNLKTALEDQEELFIETERQMAIAATAERDAAQARDAARRGLDFSAEELRQANQRADRFEELYEAEVQAAAANARAAASDAASNLRAARTEKELAEKESREWRRRVEVAEQKLVTLTQMVEESIGMESPEQPDMKSPNEEEVAWLRQECECHHRSADEARADAEAAEKRCHEAEAAREALQDELAELKLAKGNVFGKNLQNEESEEETSRYRRTSRATQELLRVEGELGLDEDAEPEGGWLNSSDPSLTSAMSAAREGRLRLALNRSIQLRRNGPESLLNRSQSRREARGKAGPSLLQQAMAAARENPGLLLSPEMGGSQSGSRNASFSGLNSSIRASSFRHNSIRSPRSRPEMHHNFMRERANSYQKQ